MVQYNMPTFSMELPGSFSDFTGGDTLRAQEFDYVVAGAGGDPMHKAIAEIYASTQAGGQGEQQRAMLIEELSRKSGRPVTQETINYVLAQMDKGIFQNETGGSEFDNSITSQEKADVASAQASGAKTVEEINEWLRKKESPTRIGLNKKGQIIEIPPKKSETKVEEKKITPSDRQPGIGIANNREVEEVEEKVTFKDRLRDLWADGSKRNAILSGISETLLETRVGADAYGNRFRDLPKNVSDKMMQAEALDMVKDQAMLDMIKTQAETQAAIDPRQFLSNTQKNARDFATAKGSKEGYAYGSKEWNAAYAGAIQEMTMENLLTAPVEGIAAISEMLAKNTGMFDEKTIELFKDVISQLTNRIQGEPIGKTRSSKTIIQGGTN